MIINLIIFSPILLNYLFFFLVIVFIKKKTKTNSNMHSATNIAGVCIPMHKRLKAGVINSKICISKGGQIEYDFSK